MRAITFQFNLLAWFVCVAATASAANPPLSPEGEIAVRRAEQAALESRPDGSPQSWRTSLHEAGTVIPRRTWKSASGHYCRAFTRTIRVGVDIFQEDGLVACRLQKGQWKRVEG